MTFFRVYVAILSHLYLYNSFFLKKVQNHEDKSGNYEIKSQFFFFFMAETASICIPLTTITQKSRRVYSVCIWCQRRIWKDTAGNTHTHTHLSKVKRHIQAFWHLSWTQSSSDARTISLRSVITLKIAFIKVCLPWLTAKATKIHKTIRVFVN